MKRPPQPKHPILIVDDEPLALETLEFNLRANGYTHIILCADPREVMGIMAEQRISVVLLDLIMPHIHGTELLDQISEAYPEVPVVVVTAMDDIQTAVRCMRAKADDYLVKPVEENQLMNAVWRALVLKEMRTEIDGLRRSVFADDLACPEAFSKILTRNGDMLAYFQYAEAVSRSSLPLLITGETGTGKTLLAEAVHTCSRCAGPFVPVAVSGMDDIAFSDTLFGHVRFAFPGADRDRPGAIQEAAGGTLFLDEIGDLSRKSQERLLKLVQEGVFYPVGSEKPRRSSARLVTATHRSLPDLISQGVFRNDLYFRLKIHQVELPPLRDRMDDLPLLLDYFLEQAAEEYGKNKPTPPDELVTLLRNHPFAGNVRELRSMVFDAVASHQSKMLSLEVFRQKIRERPPSMNGFVRRAVNGKNPLAYWRTLPTVKEATLMLILEALRRTEENKTMAAQMLGITRQTLAKYLHGETEKSAGE
ncbi:MAG: sigma-54-dependent transcriptional regulator [Thermodesulfobacteriota bacterium]